MKRNTPIKKQGSSARKQLEHELDALWSKAIFKKYNGRCAKCGRPDYLSAHHIISRKHHATRWEVENGILLCLYHHLHWAHIEPVLFYQFLEERFGKQFLNDLAERGQTITHWGIPDLLEIKEKLEKYLEN